MRNQLSSRTGRGGYVQGPDEFPVHAVPASEVLLSPELELPEGTAIFPVLISRSGRTSEVLQVAELLRQRNIEFLAVTCDANELGKLSARTLQLPVTEKRSS